MFTLICFALKEEAAPFWKIAAGKSGVSILLTGIGHQNAEKSLCEFLGSAPASGAAVDASSTAKANDEASFATREGAHASQLVLTCGFAGGLKPDLKLGDVVFELSELQLPNSQLRAQLLASGAKSAKFFCADRIATTVAEKKKLRAETGADAVEMESAAIHAVCRERGIPCVTVRVISDTASEDLPLNFNALSKPDKNLDFGKLFLAIAKSPGKIGALMQLQKKTKFAAERLAGVLAKIIAQ
jgi:adenosylhomocysteine nucleosidase